MTIEGFRAKNDDKTANARQIILPDGRKVFSGSAEDGGPGKAKENVQKYFINLMEPIMDLAHLGHWKC